MINLYLCKICTEVVFTFPWYVAAYLVYLIPYSMWKSIGNIKKVQIRIKSALSVHICLGLQFIIAKSCGYYHGRATNHDLRTWALLTEKQWIMLGDLPMSESNEGTPVDARRRLFSIDGFVPGIGVTFAPFLWNPRGFGADSCISGSSLIQTYANVIVHYLLVNLACQSGIHHTVINLQWPTDLHLP